MNRRNFINKSLIGSLACLFLPSILKGAEKKNNLYQIKCSGSYHNVEFILGGTQNLRIGDKIFISTNLGKFEQVFQVMEINKL